MAYRYSRCLECGGKFQVPMVVSGRNTYLFCAWRCANAYLVRRDGIAETRTGFLGGKAASIPTTIRTYGSSKEIEEWLKSVKALPRRLVPIRELRRRWPERKSSSLSG